MLQSRRQLVTGGRNSENLHPAFVPQVPHLESLWEHLFNLSSTLKLKDKICTSLLPSKLVKMAPKIAIQNVLIFDGEKLSPPSTVIISSGLIESVESRSSDLSGVSTIDGNNQVLLPGLIDSHIHLHGPHNLHELARWSVTTGLDMAAWPPSRLASLRAASHDGEGVTDIRSPGTPACAPHSNHSRIPGFPVEEFVGSEAEAVRFVERRVGEGVDYVKMIADMPGLEQGALNALAV